MSLTLPLICAFDPLICVVDPLIRSVDPLIRCGRDHHRLCKSAAEEFPQTFLSNRIPDHLKILGCKQVSGQIEWLFDWPGAKSFDRFLLCRNA